jgi:hypothetical protein
MALLAGRGLLAKIQRGDTMAKIGLSQIKMWRVTT